MHSLVVVLLVLVGYSQAVPYDPLLDEEWEAFKLEHGKFYQDEYAEAQRKEIFKDNHRKVAEHNHLYDMGLTSYRMAVNSLSDLTSEEFMRFYTVNMTDIPQQESEFGDDIFSREVISDEDVDVSVLPGQVDWRSHGAVTPVKNQGQCGSCWSFSSTGALEAQWYKKTKRLISLSEQNLVDCSWKYNNHGCQGGWMANAFRYIKDNGGIDSEQSYPYQARDGFCHYNSRAKIATVRGTVQFQGERQLQQKVSSVGPISVAIEVNHRFHMYHSGVHDDPQCGHKINHAVLVVGYGNENGKDYWLVKNSWGADWGLGGYIKMARNRNSQCGIADFPTYPLV